MGCEYLIGETHPLCQAVQGLIAPPLAHLNRYCRSDVSHCPVRQRYAAARATVPLDAAAVLIDAATARRATGPTTSSASDDSRRQVAFGLWR